MIESIVNALANLATCRLRHGNRSSLADHESFPTDDSETCQHAFRFVDLANPAQIEETAKADVAGDERWQFFIFLLAFENTRHHAG